MDTTLKVLFVDAASGLYRVNRYRVGDFFGPVDLGIHLAFKHNALTIGGGLDTNSGLVYYDGTGAYAALVAGLGNTYYNLQFSNTGAGSWTTAAALTVNSNLTVSAGTVTLGNTLDVNADFIQDVTFFTGGFPMKYGDALSSVLLIENRPGSPDGIAGDVTLGASEAGVTLDGPLGERANWLFSVRRSYLQFLFQALDLPIRPDYWDGQVSLNWEPNGRDRFTFTGIGALDDGVNAAGIDERQPQGADRGQVVGEPAAVEDEVRLGVRGGVGRGD